MDISAFFVFISQGAAFDPRVVMATCFGLACICALAARRLFVAIALALATTEALKNWRFVFREAVKPIAKDYFGGWSPFEIQSAFLAAAAIAGLPLCVIVVRSLIRETMWRRLAVLGLSLIMAMLIIELISREDMERVIYAKIGPQILYVWWMAISALLVAIASLGDLYSKRASRA